MQSVYECLSFFCFFLFPEGFSVCSTLLTLNVYTFFPAWIPGIHFGIMELLQSTHIRPPRQFLRFSPQSCIFLIISLVRALQAVFHQRNYYTSRLFLDIIQMNFYNPYILLNKYVYIIILCLCGANLACTLLIYSQGVLKKWLYIQYCFRLYIYPTIGEICECLMKTT